MIKRTISVEDILCFGIRLSDGRPFFCTMKKDVILMLMGDYEAIKRDCMSTGLFEDASTRWAAWHSEAFIRTSFFN